MARYTYKHFKYLCPKCEAISFILKETRDTEREESCTGCKNPLTLENRVVENSRRAINNLIVGAKVEDAEYNPGLGVVTKSKRHREEVARQIGAVEIGNDYKSSDAMSKEFDKKREDKINKNWEDA